MFANATWKQAVMDHLLAIVGSAGRPEFGLQDLYDRQAELQELFPRNRHVRDKIRQVLQFLRDDGLIVFCGGAQYRLDLDSPHLEVAAADRLPPGREAPPLRRTGTLVRLRDTVLGISLKTLYAYRCQVCDGTVPLTLTDYAESHHLRPLGSPHCGPDTPGNIIVLCPNHHAMFDRGAAAIEPGTLALVHGRPAVRIERSHLRLVRTHRLAHAHVSYHYLNIFRRA